MRTVTKPVILPIVSPITTTSMNRKVLTPTLFGPTRKVLLTSNKQLPGTNHTRQETIGIHAINNIQTGQLKKTAILQSKDSIKTRQESPPVH